LLFSNYLGENNLLNFNVFYYVLLKLFTARNSGFWTYTSATGSNVT